MNDRQIAAYAIGCTVGEIESAERDANGFLHIRHHNTYKRLTPERVAALERELEGLGDVPDELKIKRAALDDSVTLSASTIASGGEGGQPRQNERGLPAPFDIPDDDAGGSPGPIGGSGDASGDITMSDGASASPKKTVRSHKRGR